MPFANTFGCLSRSSRRYVIADEIGSLADEQAIRAAKLFFDRAPPEIWEDSRKPSAERVKTVAAALLQEAPSELKPIVGSFVEGGKPALYPPSCINDAQSCFPKVKSPFLAEDIRI
jgi:hypothetical protein